MALGVSTVVVSIVTEAGELKHSVWCGTIRISVRVRVCVGAELNRVIHSDVFGVFQSFDVPFFFLNDVNRASPESGGWLTRLYSDRKGRHKYQLLSLGSRIVVYLKPELSNTARSVSKQPIETFLHAQLSQLLNCIEDVCVRVYVHQ